MKQRGLNYIEAEGMTETLSHYYISLTYYINLGSQIAIENLIPIRVIGKQFHRERLCRANSKDFNKVNI